MNINRITILNMSSDENKGDFAILESTIHLLEKKVKDIVIINADRDSKECKKMKWIRKLGYRHLGAFIPRDPANNIFLKSTRYILKLFISLYSLSLIYLFQKNIKNLLFAIPKHMQKPICRIIESDLIILKGGSYLYSHGKLKDHWFLYRMTFPIIISILLNKRIFAIGISLGVLKGKISNSIMKFVLKNIDLIIVREELSCKIVKRFVKDKNVRILPDIAFLKAKSSKNSIEGIFKNENIPYPKKIYKIGITARDWHFPDKPSRKVELQKKYKETLIETGREIIENYNAELYFMPHCLRDIAFEKILAEKIGERAHVLKGDYPPEILREIYG